MARRNSLAQLSWDAWALGLEASTVMGLRTLRIATGGDPDGVEARRMISEKIEAAMALQTLAFSGALGLSAVSVTAGTMKHYRRKVRANRRRLSRA
jgi:hypothetical protein